MRKVLRIERPSEGLGRVAQGPAEGMIERERHGRFKPCAGREQGQHLVWCRFAGPREIIASGEEPGGEPWGFPCMLPRPGKRLPESAREKDLSRPSPVDLLSFGPVGVPERGESSFLPSVGDPPSWRGVLALRRCSEGQTASRERRKTALEGGARLDVIRAHRTSERSHSFTHGDARRRIDRGRSSREPGEQHGFEQCRVALLHVHLHRLRGVSHRRRRRPVEDGSSRLGGPESTGCSNPRSSKIGVPEAKLFRPCMIQNASRVPRHAHRLAARRRSQRGWIVRRAS